MEVQTLERVICYLDVDVAKFERMMKDTFDVVPQRIEKREEALLFSIGSKDFQAIKQEKIKIGGKQVTVI